MSFFPTYNAAKKDMNDFILSRKGEEISLYLPIQVGSQTKEYNFVFKVTGIEPVPVKK